MRTPERIIRQAVIKGLPRKLHHVRVATLVIIVTAAALCSCGLAASVESGFSTDIRRHLLVTVKTQGGLAFLAEGFVALAAVILVFRVPFNQRPRHQQCLETGRPGILIGRYQHQYHC